MRLPVQPLDHRQWNGDRHTIAAGANSPADHDAARLGGPPIHHILSAMGLGERTQAGIAAFGAVYAPVAGR
jgi:hypothetical protein